MKFACIIWLILLGKFNDFTIKTWRGTKALWSLDKIWDPECNKNASVKSHWCVNSLKLKDFQKPQFKNSKSYVWLYRCILNDKYFIYGGWGVEVPECGTYIFGEGCSGLVTPWPLAEKRNDAVLNIISCNHLCFIPSIRRDGWLLKICLQQAQLWIR